MTKLSIRLAAIAKKPREVQCMFSDIGLTFILLGWQPFCERTARYREDIVVIQSLSESVTLSSFI